MMRSDCWADMKPTLSLCRFIGFISLPDTELVDGKFCEFQQVLDGLGIVPKALPIVRRYADTLADISPCQAVKKHDNSPVQLGTVELSELHDLFLSIMGFSPYPPRDYRAQSGLSKDASGTPA